MFSMPAAPAKQSVGETISVLSERLGSSTLLEDRRAAILGLRSFAKQYPASVASGALRSLIGSLAKDGEDVDTVKVVLETLLMLFSPNQDSPEASDEIALWLADEFTQRQENITLLLDFLETPDFYARLYSLQLLTAILSARTERTEECVFTAPLGIPRLVAILDDTREAVRNEAITLLTYLTPTNPDIQKLVAFESAFERILKVVAADGGLALGTRVVEDCLILLANLLRLNPSNQTLFRETGCIPQLTKLLRTAYEDENDGEHEIASWAEEQRNRNVYALLAVVRLFLVAGSVGTPQNQAALWHHGLLFHALQLGFMHHADAQIKAEALVTCADIIRGNAALQENFAQLQVPAPPGPQQLPPADKKANGVANIYVIDGLLDLTLSVQSAQDFNLRFAACGCIKAYFHGHAEVRQHFLTRAIEGHRSGADETANVLTTLLRSPADESPSDPYRYWFAAVIMLHLIIDSPESKALAMGVTEGEEESGEEVVTSIQMITAHLILGLTRGDDERVLIGSLMLLLCWLFEDIDGVNDFLGEGSNIQGLINAVIKASADAAIVQGLCAMLLGVAYEFSTKDSPIPRATLQPILLQRMGREKYIEKLSNLRSHPFVRDYEVLPQRFDPSSGQKHPDVFFDASFIEFFKDNYSRILRAIDREPGLEISVVSNGVQKGISRELVDGLRSQLEERNRELQEARLKVASLDGQLGQEQADHRRTKESQVGELARIKTVNESLQKQHEEETAKLKIQHQARENELQRQQKTKEDELRRQIEQLQRQQKAKEDDLARQHKAREDELRRQLDQAKSASAAEVDKVKKTAQADAERAQREVEQVKKSSAAELERAQRRSEAALADLKATISRLEVDLMKAGKAKTAELQSLREELEKKVTAKAAEVMEAEGKLHEAQTKVGELEKKIKEKEKRVGEAEGLLTTKEKELTKSEALVKKTEEERKSAQSELDDLLMVFGDLEEKNTKYKKVHEGAQLPKEITKEDLEDDKYLKPVLDDDAFIICLDDLPESSPAATGKAAATAAPAGDAEDLRTKNSELQAELDKLARQFADYRLAVQQTLDQRWGEDDAPAAAAAAGGASSSGGAAVAKSADGAVEKPKDDSKYYWESYAHNEIHEIMLKDTVRTEAYRDFIYNNKHLFKDKVVMDIGCGTGILSMFCARAGAKLVIAVDNSDIIDKARENIFNNGLGSTITCLKGKVEEVVLPVPQVDIIVSEWMGYCLLYEAMLPSVLWARDRYLKPDTGLVVPSHASMWVAPFADQEWVDDHVTFWRDVYGFDMRAMQEGICLDSHIEVVPSSSSAGEPSMFRMLDLHTCTTADLVFDVPYRSAATRDADRLDGFLIWFDIFFATDRNSKAVEPADVTAAAWSEDGKRGDRVAFTTGPFGKPTHWKQGILPIKQEAPAVKLVKGQPVEGSLSLTIPKDNPRGLMLKVTWKGDDGKVLDQSWEC
ncbi:hypothetical protein PspLS_03119 [Pyricularia sp. CBS 133598]|nr:hypothetical protein PspLS_03119 [Pyricularia sp. CBS 133598]